MLYRNTAVGNWSGSDIFQVGNASAAHRRASNLSSRLPPRQKPRIPQRRNFLRSRHPRRLGKKPKARPVLQLHPAEAERRRHLGQQGADGRRWVKPRHRRRRAARPARLPPCRRRLGGGGTARSIRSPRSQQGRVGFSPIGVKLVGALDSGRRFFSCVWSRPYIGGRVDRRRSAGAGAAVR